MTVRQQGYISIVCLFIGMSIIALALSVMELHSNDLFLQQSSGNRVKAQYLAESGMEMAMYQLHTWSEEAIEAYFQSKPIEGGAVPALEPYLQQHIIHKLQAINQYQHTAISPLYQEYQQEHGVFLSVEPSSDKKTLKIKVQGYYESARVYLEGRVRMPVLMMERDDEGQTDIRVRALNLETLVQSYPDL